MQVKTLENIRRLKLYKCLELHLQQEGAYPPLAPTSYAQQASHASELPRPPMKLL